MSDWFASNGPWMRAVTLGEPYHHGSASADPGHDPAELREMLEALQRKTDRERWALQAQVRDLKAALRRKRHRRKADRMGGRRGATGEA